MRKFLFTILSLLMSLTVTYAGSEELSRQATAFYSDNNTTQTMNIILQIKENERTAQDWLLLGNVLADDDQADNSAFMYQKALFKDKKCYRAYYNLGNYYFEKGMNNAAIENYKKALEIKQDNPYIFYNLACVYINTGNFKKARSCLNKAIVMKSDVKEFHYNLAYVYKKLGNKKLADTYLENYNKLAENQI